MTPLEAGLVLFVILIVLLVGGVWIAISLAAVAWVGFQFFTNSDPAPSLFQAFWRTTASDTLAALPLFVWMGEILYRTRLSEEMFEGLAPWLRWLPGRLMHVNILGCAIFGTVSGSSAATCATIAKVALPELKRRGYDEKTCLGSLAAAGTLGILLPPSIIMVVYAVAAEVSIIKVFLAGFIPGFILTALFSGYIIAWALANPAKTPREDARLTFAQKLAKTRLLVPCLALIVFVVIVMAMSWATATEAAAYGVLGALVIAWWSGGLDRQSFWASLIGATRLSCMIMFILAGASFLSSCMAFTGIPRVLAEWVASHLHPARHRARRRFDDRAHDLGGHPDGREGRLRPRLVRHLHRAAGGDRRAHPAARLQYLRAADDDRPRQQLRRPRLGALLPHDGAVHRDHHALSGDRDLAPRCADRGYQEIACST
jgi:tripartite ATP-independent transporter DctM subunit